MNKRSYAHLMGPTLTPGHPCTLRHVRSSTMR